MPPTTPKSTSFLFHRGIRGKDSLPSFPRTPIRARAVWAPSVTFGRLSGVAFDFTTRAFLLNMSIILDNSLKGMLQSGGYWL